MLGPTAFPHLNSLQGPAMFDAPPLAHYFSADHEAFRRSMRDFVGRELAPHANEWDEAGTFPVSLYRRAAELGVLGVGYPEELGGTPADVTGFARAVRGLPKSLRG